MNFFRSLKYLIPSIRAREEREIEDELQALSAIATQEAATEGVRPEDIEYRGRRALGNLTLAKENARAAWGWSWLEDFIADLRFGVRQLVRNPVLAAVSILTLALGIAANVGIFSVVYAVLLRPLPFKDASRLVLVYEYKAGNIGKTGSPFVRYLARTENNDVFEEAGGYWDVSGGNEVVFGDGSIVDRVRFSIVTRSFFPLLGVQPTLGRSFSQAEDHPPGEKVFLASYGLWSNQLGADPHSIGKTFRLDGEPYTLIGVLPKHFHFPARCDIWMPVGVLGRDLMQDRASHQFWMIGRLRPGVSVERTQTEMDGIQSQLARAYPASDSNWSIVVRPLLDELVGNVRRSLWILLGAVGFVLLIACSNVVNLLLARAVSREREFAIRTAVGAGHLRLLRQALTESLIIALTGAALSLVLGRICLESLARMSAGSIPRFEDSGLTAAASALCCCLALLTTLLVGIAPGFQASRSAPASSLGSGQRSGILNRRTAGIRNYLVISQVALTLLLLSGAGLMLRSLGQFLNVDPGFDPHHLITIKIALPEALYPRMEKRSAFLHELLDRLNASPGVEVAAATDRLPLSGERNWGAINVVGRPVLDPAHAASVEGRTVSAGYFHALGIPLLRGRLFIEADMAQGHDVIVINQAMADQFWPGADPVGQHVSSAFHPERWTEVIGVVGNVKEFGLDAAAPPEMYAPYQWWNVMNLLIRGGTDSSAVVSIVRRQAAALDKQVPVYDMASMDEVVNRSFAKVKFELLVLAAFALLALALAMIGIYGLMAFAINRRTAELGLRFALGASPTALLTLVVVQGMKLILLGTAVGILLSMALSRFLRSLLFEVSPYDPFTLAASALLLATIGTVAIVIPARRALRVDPVVALRAE